MTTHAERPAPVAEVSALRVLGAADLPAAAQHLADDPVTMILEQVESGMAVRMAVLYDLLAEGVAAADAPEALAAAG